MQKINAKQAIVGDNRPLEQKKLQMDADGNGRVDRILMNYALLTRSYPVVIIPPPAQIVLFINLHDFSLFLWYTKSEEKYENRFQGI